MAGNCDTFNRTELLPESTKETKLRRAMSGIIFIYSTRGQTSRALDALAPCDSMGLWRRQHEVFEDFN